MAGTGVQLFQDGVVLTAAQVNGYLMDQAVCVFSTPADRDNAFGGANQPTLSEGRLCYLVNDGTGNKRIQFYNGSTWVDSSSFTTPDNSITDIKVATSAAIALSKLASGTSGQIVVANASGVPTYVSLSGDATISNAGVISIGANNVALGTDTTGLYVATVAGTANQITVGGSGSETAAVTLSLPQDIATSSSTTFAGLTITGSASVAGNVVYNITTAIIASGNALSLSDSGKFIELTGNNATLTVPNTTWTAGSQITVMQMGTGSATITFTGATDIKAEPRTSASVVTFRTKFSSATLIKTADGTADWYVIGDLKA